MLQVIAVNANQQLNYSASLFYNSTNNTIEVVLYVQNSAQPSGSGCGTNKLYLAGIDFTLEYNPAILSLQSWSMWPSGQQLDYPGDYFNGSQPVPDNTIYATRDLTSYYSGRKDSTIEFIRTTNLCANTIFLDCLSSYPVFKAVFYINPSFIPTPYDVSNPNNSSYPNYIAEFSGYYTSGPNNGQIMPPSNLYKQLLINVPPNNALKSAGSTCITTTVGNNIPSINDDPTVPDVFNTTNASLSVPDFSFDAYKQNNKIYLQWTSSIEVREFEVQRKATGNFETIAIVPAETAGSNYSQKRSYIYTDPNMNSDIIYYRIKQIGFNNEEKFSEIKSIRNNKEVTVLIYPNPAHGFINVVLPDHFMSSTIVLFDYSGRAIKSWNKYQQQKLVIANIPKGFYLIKVVSNDNRESFSGKITVN